MESTYWRRWSTSRSDATASVGSDNSVGITGAVKTPADLSASLNVKVIVQLNEENKPVTTISVSSDDPSADDRVFGVDSGTQIKLGGGGVTLTKLSDLLGSDVVVEYVTQTDVATSVMANTPTSAPTPTTTPTPTQLSIDRPLTAQQVYALLQANPSVVIIDTRATGEYTGVVAAGASVSVSVSVSVGHIPGAYSVPDRKVETADLGCLSATWPT